MSNKKNNIFLHIGILILLTLPFWFLNIDISFSSLFYNKTDGWYLFNDKTVNFLYKYGIYPALIFSFFFILVLTFQKFFKNKNNLKKTAVIFLITLVFAPGIIINVILKNYTGRPRPREIIEFNGNWEYRKVWQLGQPGKGYSFPCGHCSMGFIFCSIYFVLRNKRKKLAVIAFLAGFVYGTAIGIARIAQGAHFLSDVIWSGGITIIIAEGAYYLLFDKEKEYIVKFLNINKIHTGMSTIIFTILILVLLVFFLMSVSVYREQNINLDIKTEKMKIFFNGIGNLNIKSAEVNPSIYISASGFGFPKSDYFWKVEKKEKNKITEITLYTYKKGFFKELSSDININLKKREIDEIIINNADGNIDYNMDDSVSKSVLFTKRGDIILNIDNKINELFIKNLHGNVYLNFNKNTILDNSSYIVLNSSGEVEIKNHSNFMQELNKSAKEIYGSKELFLHSKKTGHLYLNISAQKITIK